MVTANLGDNETVDEISLPFLMFIKIRNTCLCWISTILIVYIENKPPLENESSNLEIGCVKETSSKPSFGDVCFSSMTSRQLKMTDIAVTAHHTELSEVR